MTTNQNTNHSILTGPEDKVGDYGFNVDNLKNLLWRPNSVFLFKVCKYFLDRSRVQTLHVLEIEEKVLALSMIFHSVLYVKPLLFRLQTCLESSLSVSLCLWLNDDK